MRLHLCEWLPSLSSGTSTLPQGNSLLFFSMTLLSWIFYCNSFTMVHSWQLLQRTLNPPYDNKTKLFSINPVPYRKPCISSSLTAIWRCSLDSPRSQLLGSYLEEILCRVYLIDSGRLLVTPDSRTTGKHRWLFQQNQVWRPRILIPKCNITYLESLIFTLPWSYNY